MQNNGKMKTENINSKASTIGKHAYIKPNANIIRMDTKYGVMHDRSIAIDPNTPATGDGNAKQFDGDMWGDDGQ